MAEGQIQDQGGGGNHQQNPSLGGGSGGKKKGGSMGWMWNMTGGLIGRIASGGGGSPNGSGHPPVTRATNSQKIISGPQSPADQSSMKRSPSTGSGVRKKAFWNKRAQARLPGTIKQVRGAQYPPLTSRDSASMLKKQPELKSKKSTQSNRNKSIDIGSSSSLPASPVTTSGVAARETGTGAKDDDMNHDDAPQLQSTEEKEKNHDDAPQLQSTEEKEKKGKPTKNSLNALLSKRAQIFKLINEPTLDLATLRRRAWSGLCPAVRNDSWQLILGYQPANRERRGPTVTKRRNEYQDHCKKHYYGIEGDSRYSTSEKKIMHQIRLDTPRTLPSVKLLQHKSIQLLLERILYIWSIRHPASGYVQGINDLVVPFLMVFLAAKVGVEPEHLDESHLLEKHLSLVEADCFWCLSKLLDGIQDHYTAAQPGIQRMVFKLEELIHRLDQPLHAHLKKYDIRFFHFSYRWMNCLLMREVSLPLIIRVWDTYIAESDGFKVFHIYVCAAMLVKFSKDLLALEEFQDLIVFLQNLPTKDWAEKDIETLLAQAYVYKYQFEGAENHLH